MKQKTKTVLVISFLTILLLITSYLSIQYIRHFSTYKQQNTTDNNQLKTSQKREYQTETDNNQLKKVTTDEIQFIQNVLTSDENPTIRLIDALGSIKNDAICNQEELTQTLDNFDKRAEYLFSNSGEKGLDAIANRAYYEREIRKVYPIIHSSDPAYKLIYAGGLFQETFENLEQYIPNVDQLRENLKNKGFAEYGESLFVSQKHSCYINLKKEISTVSKGKYNEAETIELLSNGKLFVNNIDSEGLITLFMYDLKTKEINIILQTLNTYSVATNQEYVIPSFNRDKVFFSLATYGGYCLDEDPKCKEMNEYADKHQVQAGIFGEYIYDTKEKKLTQLVRF